MHRVYLSLGSNVNREQYITAALNALDDLFAPLIVSKFYDCEPVGFVGDNFLNLVVGFDCKESIAQLSHILREIEDKNDRVRTGPKFSARTLDIDILTYDDTIGVVNGVTLPRGEITKNAFVLLPLSDVAPEQKHPQLKKTYKRLWQEYDQGSQKLSLADFYWPNKDCN